MFGFFQCAICIGRRFPSGNWSSFPGVTEYFKEKLAEKKWDTRFLHSLTNTTEMLAKSLQAHKPYSTIRKHNFPTGAVIGSAIAGPYVTCFGYRQLNLSMNSDHDALVSESLCRTGSKMGITIVDRLLDCVSPLNCCHFLSCLMPASDSRRNHVNAKQFFEPMGVVLIPISHSCFLLSSHETRGCL